MDNGNGGLGRGRARSVDVKSLAYVQLYGRECIPLYAQITVKLLL